jgi:beta-1,4-mannosyltransferase
MILVSSTSWTEDEDFNILFESIQLYDQHRRTSPSLPPLLLIVTGKGPLKDQYQRKIKKLEGELVGMCRIVTCWLTMEDYPKLLGANTFNVSKKPTRFFNMNFMYL